MNIICSTLNAKYIHTNLAIRLLKAYASPEFNIHIKEYTIKDQTLNIVTDLYQQHPNVIGFSCYIWNIEKTMEVANLLKKVDPELVIVLGGPEVSYNAIQWMERIPEVDFIVTGEGEQTFKRLLTEIENSGDVSHVPGLAYRLDGKVHINLQSNKLDLRNIPSPYRFLEDQDALSKRITYVETSRGCPFTCQFCLSSIETGVRYFDRERVKDDIRYLMANGAKTFKFVDRTFNISRSYAMEMFRFLIDEHLPGTVFQFEITADIMRPEVIEFLNKEAPKGLFRFEIGVQSTNEHTNELVKRKQNWAKLTRTVNLVKQGGIVAQHLDLIAGLPEEDYHSFRKTFNETFAFRPEELQLGFLKMLKGTGLTAQAANYGYTYMDYPPYEMLSNHCMSFDDVIKIKQVEDVLEKYWNDHRMDHTIEYLVTNVFPSPFDFFQEFGTYWDEQGWAKIGHQLEDLFKRLYQFLDKADIKDLDMVIGFMKVDYLKSHKYKPRKPWWPASFTKSDRNQLYQRIAESPALLGTAFSNLEWTEKELHKHAMIEEISFDLNLYLQTGKIEKGSFGLLAYFDPVNYHTKLFSFQNN